jgi:hypothetical protein
MFGLLDYRGWPRCRLRSPRTERMREKTAVTPSAMSVQTKKTPLDLAIPAPFHVDDGDSRPKERPEEEEDVPRFTGTWSCRIMFTSCSANHNRMR